MDDIAIARAIHVFAVVVWIGGVAMVTTVILPIVRRGEKERLALLEAVEQRFIWQARIATLLVAASGFYMVGRLDLWDRFRTIEFWWMHAMVLLWMIFTLILFVGEPLMQRRTRHTQVVTDARLARMQWLHWVLLVLSAITVLAAVAGSQGMSLVVRF
ncbi:MAG TPA: hypothetical protein VMV19_01775 [Xanthobacteraceae bacterium]|nr:hypothetical protein [Xanthobacteraceae bacterium]